MSWQRRLIASGFIHIAILLALAITLGCKPDNNLFTDVTRQVGIDFKHVVANHEQTFFMPRSIGSGAAIFDYDNDGLLDIYLIQNGGPDSKHVNCLYRRIEGGTFQNVTEGSGLAVDGYGMGVAAGDINNDGRLEVLLTEYGRTRLFLNRTESSEPRFEDITTPAGIDNITWGSSVCFVDYDRDGWLDIVLVNYVNYDPSRWCADNASRQEFCGPDAFPGQTARLFRNQGDADGDGLGDARFSDETVNSGFAARPGPGLGVFCADFDGDRWPDIFIANDGKPNHLWVNRRDGTFSDEAITRGIAFNSMGKSEANMGIAIGDVDSNGLFDIFVTHLTTETHTLWSQSSPGNFIDKTAVSKLTASKWRGTGFGTVMTDLDNDGDLDLIIANGRVTRSTGTPDSVSASLDPFWGPYAERNQIFLNNGSGSFIDASEDNSALSEVSHVSRGLACADFNDDGAMDLLVTRVGEAPALYFNRNRNLGHWLVVRAIDATLKRDAYGAEVHVTSGGQRWMRWINPGYSYLCGNDPRAHFGLGKLDSIDRLEVVWPDGTSESFAGGAVDRVVVLRKGEGTPLAMLTPAFAVHQVPVNSERGEISSARLSQVQPARGSKATKVKGPPNIADQGMDFLIVNAVSEAREEVNRTPQSAAAWGNLGMTFLAHELNSEATECFAEADRLDGSDARWPYLQARCFTQTDATKSIELLERAVAICKNTPESPRLLLVETLLESQLLDRAEQHLDVFEKQFPRSARASHDRARLRMMKGDYQGCLDELMAFNEYVKASYDSTTAQAKLLASQDQKQQAEQLVSDANQQLRANLRKRKTAGLLMANALRQLGRTEDAEKQREFAEKQTDLGWNDPYQEEVRIRKTGVKTLLNKADLLFGAGNYDESMTILEDVIQKYPESLYGYILLARSLIRMGRVAEDERGDKESARSQYEQARAVLRRALEVDPNSVNAQFRLGVSLAYLAELDGDKSKFAEAEAWYRRAVELKDDFTMAYYNLSNVLEKQGKTEEAIDAMRNMIRCQSDHVDGLYRLGTLLARVGQYQEAEQHLRLAIKIDPSREDARLALENVRNRAGARP